jgi:predicted outer membrane repeat protein
MKKYGVLIFASLSACILAFLMCSTYFFEQALNGKPICKAYISDSLITHPQLSDSTSFRKSDTIHTGSGLFFTGIFIAGGVAIKSKYWDFGDGTIDTSAAIGHNYLKAGIFIAQYRIEDLVGGTLADTVVIHVNTPPEAPLLLRPINCSEVGTNTYPTLAWKCSDPDSGNTLHYAIFIGTDSATIKGQMKNNAFTEASYALWNSGTAMQKFYWRVFADDGYDTSWSAIDSFNVVDYAVITGSCDGFIKLQGRENHAAIQVQLRQNSKTTDFNVVTDDSGYFLMKGIMPGAYTLTMQATPVSGMEKRQEYAPIQKPIEIIIRKNVTTGIIVMRDTLPPYVSGSFNVDTVKNFDGAARVLRFSGSWLDVGAGIAADSCQFILNSVELTKKRLSEAGGECTTATLDDGHYELVVSAMDKAGNTSVTKKALVVNANSFYGNLVHDSLSINNNYQILVSCKNYSPALSHYRFIFNATQTSLWDTLISTSEPTVLVSFTPHDSCGPCYALAEAVDDSGIAVQTRIPYTTFLNRPTAKFSCWPNKGTVSINDTITLTDLSTDKNGTTKRIWSVGGRQLDDTGAVVKVNVGSTPCMLLCSLTVIDNDGLKSVVAGILPVVLDAPVTTIKNISNLWTVTIKDTVTLGETTTNQFGSYTRQWRVDGRVLADTGATIKAITGNNPGNMCCTLIVIDDDGLKDTSGLSVSVLLGVPVVSIQSASGTDTVSVNDTVTITSSFYDSFGRKTFSRRWSVDGKVLSDTGATIRTVTGGNPGNMRCTLVVTNEDDLTASAAISIPIIRSAPVIKTLTRSPLMDSISINDTIALTETTVNRFGKYIRQWRVDGKVLSDTGATVKAVAGTNAGNMLCTLIVTNDDGEKDTAALSVRVVLDIPVITALAWTYPSTYNFFSVGDTISLWQRTTKKFGTYSRKWSVDGNLLPIAGDTAKFTARKTAGTMLCTLIVTDDDNLSDTAFMPIAVRNCPPFAKAVVNDNSVFTGTQVSLSTSGSRDSNYNGKIIEYAWQIDTSSHAWTTSSGKDTIITAPSIPKTTVIVLHVTDDDGLTAFDTVRVATFLKDIYVDSAAAGKNSGETWANAFTDLQRGLAAADSGSTINIAKGTYYPASMASSDRNTSFILKLGLKIYGAFPKGGGTRDTANKTILSGDFQRDGDAYNNAYSVIKVISYRDSVALLDGLTITGGYGGNRGGGICDSAHTRFEISYCSFENNNSSTGGAFYCGGSATMQNCSFTTNSSSDGGAISTNWNTAIILSNCSFLNNGCSSYGGAISSYGSLTMSHCSLSNNTCPYNGGALFSNGSIAISDCSFKNNIGGTGGAIYSNGQATMTNCIFTSNTNTYTDGGTVNSNTGTLTIADCSFLKNTNSAVSVTNGQPSLKGCTFSGNKQSVKISGSNSAPIISRCAFTGDSTVALSSSSSAAPIISGCSFASMHSALSGTCGQFYNSHGKLFSCTFCDNKSTAKAGALLFYKSDVKVTNCTFIRDSAASGGACYDSAGSKTVYTNCTFTSNVATAAGGAVYDSGTVSDSAKPIFTNCLFWNNSAPLDHEIRTGANAAPSFINCIIQDGYSGPGTVTGTITTDPLLGTFGNNGGPVFTIPIGATGSAHDAGTTAVPIGVDISTDARELPRSDGKPDIGAYEVQ